MALADRIDLYKKLEDHRKRPLIVYVTSIRENMSGQIGADAIAELQSQLGALDNAGHKEIDLFIVSNGGDPTVAWRIVSLIREQVKRFSILVPQAAFSAATLIALGADKIVMHANGNLGPTDPQILNRKKGINFGSEDIQSLLRFARDEVRLTDQQHLKDLFLKLCEEVGVTSLGVAARGAQLGRYMSEAMLRLHMPESGDAGKRQSAKAISESLSTKYFHHGYPLNRREAKEIGLPVEEADADTGKLMWSIWKDIERELKIRQPFNPLQILRDNAASAAAIFGPVPQLGLPPGAPPMVMQMLAQQYASHFASASVPPAPFESIVGIMESPRHASRAVNYGQIFGARQPDMEFKLQVVVQQSGWEDVSIPTSGTPVASQNGQNVT
jgi:hypothetical protein